MVWAYRFFVLGLSVAVLAFGMRDDWSKLLVLALFYTSFAFLMYNNIKNKSGLYKTPGLLPLMCVLVYMILQVIPMPLWFLHIISPESERLYTSTLILNSNLKHGMVSVSPYLTRSEIHRFFLLIIVYFLAVQLFTNRNLLKKITIFVAIFSSGLSLFSIIQHYTSDNQMFWFRELAGSHFGPYAYRNHYSSFIAMLFPISFGMFHANRRKIRYGSKMERLIELFNTKEMNYRLLYGLSAVLIVVSVFVSLSRGGVITVIISVMTLSTYYFYQKNNNEKAPVLFCFALVIILGVTWFGWTELITRFSNMITEDGRISNLRYSFWTDSINIWSNFKFMGCGFGAFSDIYPSYQSVFTHGNTVGHAHGDYHELIATGGVAGLLLFVVAFLTIAISIAKSLRDRKDSTGKMICVSVCTGLISFMIHSIVDFNFYSGANAIWFFFLGGLAVSYANTSMKRTSKTYLGIGQASKLLPIVFVAVTIVCLSVGWNIQSTMRAKHYFQPVRGLTLSSNITDYEVKKLIERVEKAVRLEPLNQRYQISLGSLFYFQKNYERAMNAFSSASHLGPASSNLFHRSSSYYQRLSNPDKIQCLKNAASYDVRNPKRYRDIATSFFKLGNRTDGLESMKRSIEIDPSNINVVECVMAMVGSGLKFDEIEKIFLDIDGYPSIAVAQIFNKFGRDDLYTKVIDRLYQDLTSEMDIEYFIALHYCFFGLSDHQRALDILKHALSDYGDSDIIHVLMGNVYAELEIDYRADEEYRVALAINPNNIEAQSKLQ